MNGPTLVEDARQGEPVVCVERLGELVLEEARFTAVERARVHRALAPGVEALHVHPRHRAAAYARPKERPLLTV